MRVIILNATTVAAAAAAAAAAFTYYARYISIPLSPVQYDRLQVAVAGYSKGKKAAQAMTQTSSTAYHLLIAG